MHLRVPGKDKETMHQTVYMVLFEEQDISLFLILHTFSITCIFKAA